MIKLLRCEFSKIKGRYVFLTALVITAAQLCWGLYGKYEGIMLQQGWMAFLYQLPLVNAIFFPILSTIISSRLCDTEHKGAMFKQLAVITEKGRIYDVKFIFGLAITLTCVLITWIVTVVFGYITGFSGDVPIGLYLLYLAFTIVPTMAVYIFQHALAMMFKNQSVPFFAGIIGTFAGLFSMFLPQLPLLRKLLIWGGYGALQFVGLFNWSKETKYAEAYFAVMDIDWVYLGILIAACVVMYIIGRSIFSRKEV